MKTQLHIKILSFLILTTFQFVKSQSFTELTTASLPGLSYSSSAWGDYDNDGDLDVLLTGYDGNYNVSSIYRNNSDGTFTNINAGLIKVYTSSVAWGDFDNDGDLDILLTGNSTSGRNSIIYRNNGDDTFTNINASLPGVWSGSATWGDFDNDGDLDVLLTGNTAGGSTQVRISEIYRNNGDATFTSINAGLPGIMSSSVAWGDYDNDGDLDILLTGGTAYGEQISEIYKNNGDDTFTSINAGLTGVYYSSVAWGDFDNDGDLDVLFTGSTWTSSTSEIYINNGNDTFINVNTAGLQGAWASSAAWGDYDNDGDLDVLLAGTGSVYFSRIYKNNGDATFTDINAGLPPVFDGSVAWADFDNDGDLDVLLTGKGINELRTRIYVNNSTQSNNLPSPPSNLSAVVNGNEVTLSWPASTDTETPSSGLSYNVFIKEAPSSASIYLKSPMASESNGWRKLPALGNTMQNTSYKYKVPASLINSNFTFKVQAIDSGFSGSAFSAEFGFSTLAIDSFDDERTIKIYPNPVSNSLIIEAPFTGNLQLKVINNLGQLVLKQNQNTSSIILDVSNLSKGLYFLNITSEAGNSQTIKFIKK
jgi:hypothetical protein